MTTTNPALRALLIYALVLPLALVMGYLLATPTDLPTLALVGLVLAVLLSPFFLKYHHPMLFLTWNMTAVAFFLPGRPEFWMLFAFGSLLISIVQRALVREKRMIFEPSLFWPLVFLALVVVVTGHFTGGVFGMQVLGSERLGGKRYLNILAAVAGFFAMSWARIPPRKALLFVGLYFLGSLANTIGSLVPRLPDAFIYLGLIFPVTQNDIGGTTWDLRPSAPGEGITRLYGLTTTCGWVFAYLLARYGLRDLMAGKRIWVSLLLLTVMFLGCLGGFRSFLVNSAVILLTLFFFEGLFRTKYAVHLAMACLVMGVLLVTQVNRLPLSLQRSLSVLPIPVDKVARQEAEGSSEWRVRLWKLAWPMVPRYLWLGKGLGIESGEFGLASTLRGLPSGFEYEARLMAQDYHNGPLSVLLPFGLWGALGWLWFLAASLRALFLNHLHGESSLQKINTFLLAFFIAKTILWFGVFGNFYTDFAEFTGLMGLSLSLNGGICKPVRVAAPVQPALRLRPPRASFQPSANL